MSNLRLTTNHLFTTVTDYFVVKARLMKHFCPSEYNFWGNFRNFWNSGIFAISRNSCSNLSFFWNFTISRKSVLRIRIPNATPILPRFTPILPWRTTSYKRWKIQAAKQSGVFQSKWIRKKQDWKEETAT